jgi:hypothetical protein
MRLENWPKATAGRALAGCGKNFDFSQVRLEAIERL